MPTHVHLLSMFILLAAAMLVVQAVATNAELDDTLARLRATPATPTPTPERRLLLKTIQDAADALTPAAYKVYMTANATEADAAARDGALYLLETSTRAAMAEIHATRVTRGVVIWHLYNMGYVVKTPQACFGIDLCFRDSRRLVPDLDFLLVTHEHRDHSTPELLDAMLAAKKPVVTRWYPGSTVISKATELTFGTTRVKIDIGDHHREQAGQTDNMLMFQVTCGGPAAPFTLYHSGDGNNAEKMHPDRPVDLFIYHVSVGLNATAAAGIVRPRTIFVSHLLELGHSPTPPQAWRWSLTYGLNAAKSLAPRDALVLTWGERWQAPDTTVAP
jgi:hypothetical protein